MLLVASFTLIVAAAAGLVWYCVVFPVEPSSGALPTLRAEEKDLARRLQAHVAAVASVPHNIAHYRALEAAACHIEHHLTISGYAPRLQEFIVEGRPVRNIEVLLPGREEAARTLVIGAHYDSHDDSPGANDNGTGVAALLELARLMRDAAPLRATLRLVFFVNEEQPYGKTDEMGSLRHARVLQQAGVPITGMIALETLGYFSDAPDSQRYPPPFGLIYPRRGNFVAFVGMLKARAFTHDCVRAFRGATDFPAIGGVAAGFIPGIDLSDHWAYDQCGYPALMVTDTAPFRNPHYHRTDDLPDTVDYAALARITLGLAGMIGRLAA